MSISSLLGSFPQSELKVAVMADWDADDFEPEAPAAVTVAKATDKWEGEDEDDDVKVILFYKCLSVMVEFHVG